MEIFWNVILGIALIIFGNWLTVKQIKFFDKGGKDSLGGNGRLLIIAIACIISGIVVIAQQL